MSKKDTKVKNNNFKFNDHVSKVTISKNASSNILQLLNRCNFDCDVIVKKEKNEQK